MYERFHTFFSAFSKLYNIQGCVLGRSVNKHQIKRRILYRQQFWTVTVNVTRPSDDHKGQSRTFIFKEQKPLRKYVSHTLTHSHTPSVCCILPALRSNTGFILLSTPDVLPPPLPQSTRCNEGFWMLTIDRWRGRTNDLAVWSGWNGGKLILVLRQGQCCRLVFKAKRFESENKSRWGLRSEQSCDTSFSKKLSPILVEKSSLRGSELVL